MAITDGRLLASVDDLGIYRMPTGKYNIYHMSTGRYYTGNYTSLERAYETAKEKAAVLSVIESPIEPIANIEVSRSIPQTITKFGDPFYVSSYQRRMFEV